MRIVWIVIDDEDDFIFCRFIGWSFGRNRFFERGEQLLHAVERPLILFDYSSKLGVVLFQWHPETY
jgi:hypothetical protein